MLLDVLVGGAALAIIIYVALLVYFLYWLQSTACAVQNYLTSWPTPSETLLKYLEFLRSAGGAALDYFRTDQVLPETEARATY